MSFFTLKAGELNQVVIMFWSQLNVYQQPIVLYNSSICYIKRKKKKLGLDLTCLSVSDLVS